MITVKSGTFGHNALFTFLIEKDDVNSSQVRASKKVQEVKKENFKRENRTRRNRHPVYAVQLLFRRPCLLVVG